MAHHVIGRGGELACLMSNDVSRSCQILTALIQSVDELVVRCALKASGAVPLDW